MAIFDNNDEDDFDFEDFNPDEYDTEEIRREIEEEDKRVRNMPIMKKAEEIYELTNAICESMSDDDPMADMTKGLMLENAMILSSKIAGAEGGDLYPLRILCQNAELILWQLVRCLLHSPMQFVYYQRFAK